MGVLLFFLLDLFQGNPGMSMLPLPVQSTWSTIPHYTSAPMHSTPFLHLSGPGMLSQSATNSVPIATPRMPSPTQMHRINTMSASNGPQILGQMPSGGSQQLHDGRAVEQGATKLFLSEPITQIVNQGSTPPVKISSPLHTNTRENSESVLPGIETLLNAIQVVEGEAGPANNQDSSTFTKFTALNSTDLDETRLEF